MLGSIPVGTVYRRDNKVVSAFAYDSFYSSHSREGNYKKLQSGLSGYFLANKIGGDVIPVFLDAKRPKIIDNKKRRVIISEHAQQSKGKDSVLMKNLEDPLMANHWTVYNSNQIKSATDNAGTFDRESPSLRKFVGTILVMKKSLFTEEYLRGLARSKYADKLKISESAGAMPRPMTNLSIFASSYWII
jgi:hypothetical protein